MGGSLPGSHGLRRLAADPGKLAAAIGSGIALGYLAILALAFAKHLWIIDPAGHPVVNDYVVFWTVGHMALKGVGLAAYNARLEHAAELATIGRPFTELLGWAYPPAFLFAVSVLACLPYALGFMLWCSSTLALEAGVVAAIAKRPAAFAIACAMPWVPIECIEGQNGFLTAAIIGCVLLTLEKRPIVSGLVLGLLSYKPQFGILFPVALLAGGYWRAFASAALSVILINLAAGAVFGFEIFGAFLHALTVAGGSHLARSELGWIKLQSIYGLLRCLGAPALVAWTGQALASLAAAFAIAVCWRSRMIAFPLKAAALALAAPLATPYVLYYDVPVLAVALAFLYRHRSFDRTELLAVAIIMPVLFAPFVVTGSGALLSVAVVCVLLVRRLVLLSEHSPDDALRFAASPLKTQAGTTP